MHISIISEWAEKAHLYRGDEPQIHNGADDNASGTTGVLELAEKFASVKDQLKRSIAFFTFSGEELGLAWFKLSR